jgi:hypothetical protein
VASDGTLVEVVLGVGTAVGCGCLGCSAGLGTPKGEGPDPVLPTLGKVNDGFTVRIVSGLVTGVGRLDGNENDDAGVRVGLEVVVGGGAGVAGLEKKLGTAVLVAEGEGSGFTVGVGVAVVAGLEKKLGTADRAGAGTLVNDEGAGAGVANVFFGGSLVSTVVVGLVAGFGCVEVAERGVNEFEVMVLVAEVVVGGLNDTTGPGPEAGEGFFSFSAAFFWS